MNPVSPNRSPTWPWTSAEIPVAERGHEPAVELVRHGRGDVVDDGADRVRAVRNLAGAFQDLDPLETFDRGVVIRRVVPVRRVRDRNAVFQQQHLAGAGRVQAADPQVRAQPEAFLVAREDTGHLAHRFVDREHAGLRQHLAAQHLGRAGDRVEPDAVPDHGDHGFQVVEGRGRCVVGPGIDRGGEQDCGNRELGHGRTGGVAGASGVHREPGVWKPELRATLLAPCLDVNANHSYSY